MSNRISKLGACLALTGALAGASQAIGATPAAHTDSCFLASDWDGWKSPSPNVIYVRVGVSRIFKLDLSSGSNQLQEPDMHLVSQIRGSSWICSPLDLQLQLSDNHGAFQEPLIVKSMTRLTPEQIAAIPKKYLP
jgi:hypothetical protein